MNLFKKKSESPEITDTHPELVDRRRNFVPASWQRLSDEEPALHLGGQLNDDVVEDDRSRQNVLDQVLLQAMPLTKKKEIEPNGFDFVLIYDAAQSKVFLGDERHPGGIQEENYFMRAELSGERVNIQLSDGGEIPPMDVLLDPNLFVHSSCYKPGMLMLRAVEQILDAGCSVCLVIDHPEQFCSCDDSDGHEARLLQIIRQCQGTKSRVVLMDRTGGVNGEIKPSVLSYTMPGTTEADAKVLLEPHFDGDQLILAAKLSARTRSAQIVRLADEHGKSDEFFDKLRSERARAIEKDSGGILKASFQPIDDRAIALPPAQKQYWEDLAAACRKDPSVLSNGSLLVGPPGTGKSIAPKYVASLLGLPYVELVDLSTSGLSNVSLDKAKRAFEALKAHAPCILRIDEISKVFPNLETTPFRNNNDEQLMAYLQTVLADDEFMRGIMVIGTDNFPEQLSTALLRHGRFGNKIAMLPPQTRQERVDVFKALWYQKPLLYERHDVPGDELLATLVETLPAYAMGGDYGELLDRVATQMLSGRQTELWPALQEATAYMAETLIPTPRYEEIVTESLRLHNAFPMDPPAVSEEGPLVLADEPAMFIAAMEAERTKVRKQLKELRAFSANNEQHAFDRAEELSKTVSDQKAAISASREELEKITADLQAEADRVLNTTQSDAEGLQKQVTDLTTLVKAQETIYEEALQQADLLLQRRKREIREAEDAATEKYKSERTALEEVQREHAQIIEKANEDLRKAMDQLEVDRQALEQTVAEKVSQKVEEAEQQIDAQAAQQEQRAKELQKLQRLLAQQRESQAAQGQTVEQGVDFIRKVADGLLDLAQAEGLDAKVCERVRQTWADLDQRMASLRLMTSGAAAEQTSIDELAEPDHEDLS